VNILIAVDDSNESEDLARAVIDQFSREGTEVRVIHVDRWPEGLPLSSTFVRGATAGAVIGAEHHRRRVAAEGAVAWATGLLRGGGFKASGDVLLGEVPQMILDVARTWPADLIVMGTHDKKGLERLLLGSVSEKVAREAMCSVEVVRDRGARRAKADGDQSSTGGVS